MDGGLDVDMNAVYYDTAVGAVSEGDKTEVPEGKRLPTQDDVGPKTHAEAMHGGRVRVAVGAGRRSTRRFTTTR